MNEIISNNLQNSIIFLSITNSDFLKSIAGQLPPDFLLTDEARNSFKICLQYLKKYKKAPGNHFQDEALKFADKHLDEEKRELFARYLLHINKERNPDKEYVLGRLSAFIRERSFTHALYESAELMDKGDIDQASLTMTGALKSGIEKQDFGLDYLVDYSNLGERGEKPNYLMNLGIEPIDYRIGGLSRGELVLIVGAYKGTKSFFGHHLGLHALKLGLKVLHISHENSLAEMELRYDMMSGFLINEKKPMEVEWRWHDKKKNRIRTEMKKRNTVYSRKIVVQNRKKMMSFGGKLILKKYPMGTCTVMELESYIEYLENFQDFKPDVIINDYADIMRPLNPKKDPRDVLNETYISLKGIADSKGAVMITMSQVNRDGLRSSALDGRISSEHLAEDIRKVGNIDKGFYVSRTRELEENHEAVLGCFANRQKTQNIECVIGQNLECGQFVTYSYLDKERPA